MSTLIAAVTELPQQLQVSWQLLVSALSNFWSGSTDDAISLEWVVPHVLWFIPLPLLVFWLLRHRRTALTALRLPVDLVLNTEASGERHGNRPGWLLLAFTGWLLLLMATARPTWVGPPLDTPVSGRDLLLAIDISGSMRENDLYQGNQSYSRIDVVRQVASEFVERRAGDRIGLIMFGSNAYVQAPLTLDHRTVAHFIREAVVGLAGRSTAIGDAIGLGVKRLRNRPVDSRIMLLLTDGSNSAGVVEPLDAARVAAQNNVKIHTIGVGADREEQSLFGLRVRASASDLDEKTLIQVAETTGGQYFRARDVADLRRVYTLIDELEPIESEEENFRVRHELFMWPLGLALLLSMLMTILWHGRTALKSEPQSKL